MTSPIETTLSRLDLSGPADSDTPDPRTRLWLTVHLTTLALAAAALFWFNRDQWFFGDEWAFIANRGLVDSRLGIWYPHNEHWSTVPILAYTAMINVFGFGSYWPYISLLIAVHLSLAHLLWRVMMVAGTSPAIATAVAAIFSLLGSGADNLLWAFQIGFVGSLAAGWAAALVVNRAGRLNRRNGWAVLLLVVSLMCSGIGVVAVAMVTLLTLATARGLVRPLLIGGIPTAIFLLWYLVTPKAPAAATVPAADGGPVELVKFVLRGLANSIGTATGLPKWPAVLVVTVIGLWAVWMTVGIVRRQPAATAGAIAVVGLYGAAGFFLLSGFGRGGADTALRYIYVAMALALPGLSLALSRLARPAWAQAVVVCGCAAVLMVNVVLLADRAGVEAQREELFRQSVDAAAALMADGQPLVGDTIDPTLNPDLTTDLLPWLIEHGMTFRPPTPQGLKEAGLGLQINLDATKPLPTTAPAPQVLESGDVTITPMSPSDGRACVAVTAAGAEPHFTLAGSAGVTTLTVASPIGGPFAIALRDHPELGQQVNLLESDRVRTVQVSLPAGTAFRLTMAMPESVVCGLS